MKAIISLLIVISLTACSYDIPEQAQVDWLLGSDQTEYEYSFTNRTDRPFDLRLLSNSLCPNTGIRVVVNTEQQNLLDSVISGPIIEHSLTFTTPESENIKITTSLVPLKDSLETDCVWLGQVKCSLQY